MPSVGARGAPQFAPFAMDDGWAQAHASELGDGASGDRVVGAAEKAPWGTELNRRKNNGDDVKRMLGEGVKKMPNGTQASQFTIKFDQPVQMVSPRGPPVQASAPYGTDFTSGVRVHDGRPNTQSAPWLRDEESHRGKGRVAGGGEPGGAQFYATYGDEIRHDIEAKHAFERQRLADERAQERADVELRKQRRVW